MRTVLPAKKAFSASWAEAGSTERQKASPTSALFTSALLNGRDMVGPSRRHEFFSSAMIRKGAAPEQQGLNGPDSVRLPQHRPRCRALGHPAHAGSHRAPRRACGSDRLDRMLVQLDVTIATCGGV